MREAICTFLFLTALTGCTSARGTATAELNAERFRELSTAASDSVEPAATDDVASAPNDLLTQDSLSKADGGGTRESNDSQSLVIPSGSFETETTDQNEIRLTSLQDNSDDEQSSDVDEVPVAPIKTQSMDSAAPPDSANAGVHAIQFDEVVGSVYQSYPLLQSALYTRNVALGQQVGASGAFDTKLKGASENGPIGFYETYRQNIGVVQPTYWGGEVFAGYRIGRGEFQPWYKERETNEGGEFKAGVLVPLARNRDIDVRRAELWKAGYARSMAEPDIQAQLISYVQDASYSYWDWVAAGEYHRIAKRILSLADDRTSRFEAQVKAGLVDPPELTDNLRLVTIRQAKTSDTRRKLEQTAAKLSLYFRDDSGQPVIPAEEQLPGFPEPPAVDNDALAFDIQRALTQRPELRLMDLMRAQIQVDYQEAQNQLQPELNALLTGSQDVGGAASSKRDKSPYEGDASLYLDVPIQRRKARGKMTELQAKRAQLAAKRRMTADKISVDVQVAHAALKSAWEQVAQTRESLKYAEDLATRERTNQEAGASDLLKVTLREQYAVESAEKNIDALRLYFESLADYRAALALDQIDR